MAHQLVNGAFGADDGQGEICPELTHRYAILKQKSGEDAIPVMLHVSVTDTRHEKPRNLCLPSIPTVGIQCNLNLPLPYRLRSRFGSEAIVDSISAPGPSDVHGTIEHQPFCPISGLFLVLGFGSVMRTCGKLGDLPARQRSDHGRKFEVGGGDEMNGGVTNFEKEDTFEQGP
jgi:hypothetical protein